MFWIYMFCLSCVCWAPTDNKWPWIPESHQQPSISQLVRTSPTPTISRCVNPNNPKQCPSSYEKTVKGRLVIEPNPRRPSSASRSTSVSTEVLNGANEDASEIGFYTTQAPRWGPTSEAEPTSAGFQSGAMPANETGAEFQSLWRPADEKR